MRRVGRDGARGQRRGRRRRRLGHAHVPHARGRQEQPVPPRGPPRRDRGARRGGGRGSSTAAARPSRRLRRPARHRPAAPADDARTSARSTGSADPTATVVRKIRAAEGHPGVLDAIEGTEFHLFGVHRERALRGAPGRDHRPARTAPSAARPSTAPSGSRTSSAATRRGRFKLPATRALALAGPQFDAPEIPVAARRAAAGGAHLPRDRLRGARAASATCTSTSTTAR